MLISYSEFQKLFSMCDLNVITGQYDKFAKYATLLVEWNEKINLTAITAPEEIAQKHFLDSVLPFYLSKNLKELIRTEDIRLIDVGTGAGFPSCPLKIMQDNIKITLLDSLNKRINFLKEVSDNLGLAANCIHSRAEDGAKKGSTLRESFDIATARAVANLPVLCEYCIPYVKVGGVFCALKGSDCKEELENAKKIIETLGGEVIENTEYTLPNGDKRTLIVIKKVRETPLKYPRPKAKMKY